jgi:hypothetical protein
MRITILICAWAFAASFAGAAAQETTSSMSGGPPASAKPAVVPASAAEQDPAERSAKAIECAQKADAQGLQGKIRKHYLHKCRSSP